jgi:SAM-dependent methyltransferase
MAQSFSSGEKVIQLGSNLWNDRASESLFKGHNMQLPEAEPVSTPKGLKVSSYSSREEKAQYVWSNYSYALQGKILDVGADAGHLRKLLPAGVEYKMMGLEPNHDYICNLENPLPLESESFDTVLCFDVLEHIENIHQLFSELCRVTRKWLIIAVPNPWNDFMMMLLNGNYTKDHGLKFHHLPVSRPADRHRWFYSLSEMKAFILANGQNAGLTAESFQYIRPSWKARSVLKVVLTPVKHESVSWHDLLDGTMWVALKKTPQA